MYTNQRSQLPSLRVSPADETSGQKPARHYLPSVAAAITLILLATIAAAPAHAATMGIIPRPGTPVNLPQIPAQIRTVAVGGMPGWQIALIAAGAAVLAAIVAIAADRTRAARHRIAASSH
jgi:hypothetical protein